MRRHWRVMQRSLYLLRLGHLSSQMFADSGLLSPSRSCEDGDHMFKCNTLRIAKKRGWQLEKLIQCRRRIPNPPNKKHQKTHQKLSKTCQKNLHSLKLTVRTWKIGREGIPLQKRKWQNPRHGCESPRACLSQWPLPTSVTSRTDQVKTLKNYEKNIKTRCFWTKTSKFLSVFWGSLKPS